jgi:hypothetical protein
MAELQGTLSGVSLPALLRLFGGVGKTGCLTLGNGGAGAGPVARIYLQDGAIVAAAMLGEEGLAALDAILILVPGTQFGFTTGARPPEANITLRGAAMRAHIESVAIRGVEVRSALPSLQAIPRFVRGEPDESVAPLPVAALQTLRRVDGRQTVEQLAAGPGGAGIAATMENLAALATAGLITFRFGPRRPARPVAPPLLAPPGPPPAAPPGSPEEGPAQPNLRRARPGQRKRILGAGLGAAVVAVPFAAWALTASGAGPVPWPSPRLPMPGQVTTAPPGRPGGSFPTPAPAPGMAVAPQSPGGAVAPLAPIVPLPPAAPTAIPTAAPAAAPRLEPLSRRLTSAFENLKSGQIETAMSLDGKAQSTSRLEFDLGDGSRPARMHMSSVYSGANGPQTAERIVVGDRSWERQGNGPWRAGQAGTSVWHQVHTFLPRSEPLPDAEVQASADGATLRWQEPGYGADVTLLVDTASAQPRTMERLSGATGGLLQVTYQGWNTPVEIAPPAGI